MNPIDARIRLYFEEAEIGEQLLSTELVGKLVILDPQTHVPKQSQRQNLVVNVLEELTDGPLRLFKVVHVAGPLEGTVRVMQWYRFAQREFIGAIECL